MKLIGIILTFLIWVFICSIPVLYTLNFQYKEILSIGLGIAQGSMGMYAGVMFYKWFESKIK